MLRAAANYVVAPLHLLFELALFGVVLAAPSSQYRYVTYAVLLVGLGMLIPRRHRARRRWVYGRCWATDLERWLLRRSGDRDWRERPSMTRRILHWCGVPRRQARRVQWWVLGAFAAVYVLRVLG